MVRIFIFYCLMALPAVAMSGQCGNTYGQDYFDCTYRELGMGTVSEHDRRMAREAEHDAKVDQQLQRIEARRQGVYVPDHQFDDMRCQGLATFCGDY